MPDEWRVYAAEFTYTGERKQDDFAAILDPEAPIFGAAPDPILIGNGATKAPWSVARAQL